MLAAEIGTKRTASVSRLAIRRCAQATLRGKRHGLLGYAIAWP